MYKILKNLATRVGGLESFNRIIFNHFACRTAAFVIWYSKK